MKKSAVLLSILAGVMLCGCAGGEDAGDGNPSENESGAGSSERQNGNLYGGGDFSAQGISENTAKTAPGVQGETASQGGPYGRISISVPEGWAYEKWSYGEDSLDSGRPMNGDYGILFYPEGVEEGYIEVSYAGFFGVCGTGLKSEERTIAGKKASVGTYDDGEHWDFITFQEEYEGVVAMTFSVDSWWKEYDGQVFDILDTLSFSPKEREGGAYIYSQESEISEIGLLLTLKDISAAGATLVWDWYDPEAATGELQCGDDFSLQRRKDGQWEEVPVAIEGSYGFNAVAYLLPAGEKMEQELKWEWLYGQLSPGEYRIGKGVDNFRGSGDFDQYTIYAQFILN